MKFDELGLDPKVLSAVLEAGYETPTPIQAEAIPHALQGRDVLGIAQTGTGKTASFTLPMITLLAKGRARARMPRSLILAPTRELAAQVAENFETYGKNLRLSMALLIGGVSFADQERIIDRGVDVLIATPGRLIDHFERGKLMLTGIEIMVVDEADRMLDMGFIEDLERIFKLTPFTRQTLFFSATMPPEITRLTEEFLSNPVRVEVARASSTADIVTQKACVLPGAVRDRADREKRAALRHIIDEQGETLTNGIIFCNRKRDVSTLFKSLTSHGYNCGALHGDLEQRVRMQVLDGFRKGQVKLLVASDVAARGLDIPSVSHVFNYDVPINAEDYVHRIGRTGRAGREGAAFTIVKPSDLKALAKVEELIKKEIPRVELEGLTNAEPPAAPEPRSSSRRAEGGKRSEREEKTRDADPQEERGRRRRSRRRDAPERERDEPVIGMGDHIPAFLLREVPLPGRKKRDPADGDKVIDEEKIADEAEAPEITTDDLTPDAKERREGATVDISAEAEAGAPDPTESADAA
ncbi:MAG: DEAD/DEAH box helicase [Neomegalonema sp.]|nr:DEAD/DEAH box helicase [Neomegalonema sp.]